MKKFAALAALLLLAAACSGSDGRSTTSPEPRSSTSVVNGGAGPPNIVMILTDDQRFDTLRYMPNVKRDLVTRGELFTQAFVSNPQCCPSRATILTGNYSHTNRVYTNTSKYGGWPTFHREAEASTVATWLDSAGYRTALIGKYMNRYGPGIRFVPPGWDRWVAFDQRKGAYFNYTFNIDGDIVKYGNGRHDYSTDVLADHAVNWLSTADEPFFLLFAPYAPHKPSLPAPRDVGSGAAALPPLPPSFNEQNVQDKPGYAQRGALHTASLESAQWGDMVGSLGAVDDAVGRIVDTLASTHQLANTMIVFTSDNGLLFGEHRWTSKLVPYEESIRVPLVIRYDPLTTPNAIDDHLVVNVDYAETFASLAGAEHPETEGRDLTSILGTRSPPWRTSFLLEHRWDIRSSGKENVPTYCGVRTKRFMFVRYRNGFEELYDLAEDPYELLNRASAASARSTLERLRAKTRSLCSPLPPGMPPF